MQLLVLLVLTVSAVSLTPPCGVSTIKPDLTVGGDIQTGNAITNSVESVPHAWPWTAAVCENDWLGICKFKCAATIIGKRWALTTASCFSGNLKDWRLRAGCYNEDKKEDEEQKMSIQAIFQHQEYAPNTKMDNILIIKTTNDITFNDYIQPICLPDSDDDVLKDTQTGWITGWGYEKKKGSITKKMEQALIDIDSNEVCERTWDRKVFDSEFCAGEGDRTLCEYDEGVPLMAQTKKGTWFQHGSVGMIDDECRLPGIFSKVTYFCNWINSTTNGEVDCIKRSLY